MLCSACSSVLFVHERSSSGDAPSVLSLAVPMHPGMLPVESRWHRCNDCAMIIIGGWLCVPTPQIKVTTVGGGYLPPRPSRIWAR
jgi:hypothetical protein